MLTTLVDGYTQSLMVFTGIHIILAYSFYVPFKTGQVSLGQAGFMAVGAYAGAILTVKFGMPFAVGLMLGGLFSGIVGVCVGFPALRIKGIYLLLLTLAFAEIVQVIILTWEYTGGAQGFQGVPYNEYTLEYVYGILIVIVVFFARLERSSLGRAMDSVHEDETAAEVMGIDVVRIKLFAFGLGAFIAGLGGVMFVHFTTYMDQVSFNILFGVEILMWAVVGGATSYWGPLVGAAFLTLLPEFLRTLRDYLELVPLSWTEPFPMNRIYDFLYELLDLENEKRLIAYGLILIIMMILRPNGLITRDTLKPLQFLQRRVGHV